MLIGILVFIFGVAIFYNLYQETKDYIKTEGTLQSKILVDTRESSEGKEELYQVTYSYIVNGKQYTVPLDYLVVFEKEDPNKKVDETRIIKYNPDHPEQAVVLGHHPRQTLLFVGFMFIGIPLILFITFANDTRGTKQDRILRSRMINIIVGIFFATLGFCFYYVACNDSLSLVAAFNKSGILGVIASLISIIMFLVGSYITISNIIRKSKSKIVVLKVEDVQKKQIGNINRVLFVDETIAEGSLRSFLYRYYIYDTTSEKFQKGDNYEVDIYEYGSSLKAIPLEEKQKAIALEGFSEQDLKKVN